MDEILRKYSKLAASYIKDTNHFLQIIKDTKINNGELIATVDVTALYTNIPHEDGIEKVTKFLRKKGAKESEVFICRTLLDHILKKNYFTFNDEMYLQVSGTAMGTRCAPNYAIIFMAELEENFLQSVQLKPRLWKRFIDDIFIIWSHGEGKLKEFLDQLNVFYTSIKFTEEHSTFGIPFLDTFTYIEDNTLKTRVYHKPNDSNIYTILHVIHYNKRMQFLTVYL